MDSVVRLIDVVDDRLMSTAWSLHRALRRLRRMVHP